MSWPQTYAAFLRQLRKCPGPWRLQGEHDAIFDLVGDCPLSAVLRLEGGTTVPPQQASSPAAMAGALGMPEDLAERIAYAASPCPIVFARMPPEDHWAIIRIRADLMRICFPEDATL